MVLRNMARDLNDLVAITRTIESIGDRFQTLDKRLTISQTKAYQRQAIELVRAAHHLFQTIPNYQPTENEAKLYDQARLSLENNQVVLSALRKRLILIFKGPETSSFDSDKAKARKLRLTERCNTIRNMEPEVVLWWVKAYPTSVWEVSQMSDRTFDYLVDKMSSQRVQALHSDHDNLCAFASEGPLDSCEEYRNFTQAFHAAAYRLAQSSTGKEICDTCSRSNSCTNRFWTPIALGQ
ncbi:hypothetical protein, variant [Exophiala xenobiotica]|uniref:Uncharacterized protein n=1 Tax=Exophiala xenobiotica TaxID=348802 RepID=A0A0D2F412_9EURO|nr:hypothetical protein, variant [Exophiala xenobiotica]KIW54634.1 hypothetical protein, variant [Exophiala xenobiotica]